MPWIQSHTNVERHKKTLMMADELDLPSVYLSGHLHALWHAALEQCEDGNLAGLSARMIARFAQYDGDCEKFAALLRKYGWIDGDLLHDWLDYAGNYLRAKYHSANPQKLKEIWALHGRAEGRRPDSPPLGGLQADSSPPKGSHKEQITSYSKSLSLFKADTKLVTTSESSEGSAEGRGTEVATAGKSRKKPATSWPEPFVITDNLRRWARDEGLPDPESELDAFHDWAKSKNAVYSDWEAAFRNRLRKTRIFGTSSGRRDGGNSNNPSDRLEEQVQRALNTPLKRRERR